MNIKPREKKLLKDTLRKYAIFKVTSPLNVETKIRILKICMRL